MNGRLEGKVAVITGAASGQGAAAAALFAREGAKVAVVDLDKEGAQKVAEQIGNGDAIAFGCDVSSGTSFKETIDSAADVFGGIDILYNNAGILVRAAEGAGKAEDGGVAELDEAVYDRTVAVNQRSVYLGCKFVIPHMRKRGGGSIINVSSLSGAILGSSNHAYAASKAAVVGLTRSIALTYGPEKIRCNVLSPGLIPTALVGFVTASADKTSVYEGCPLGRLGTPDEIAQAALFLASDESSFVTGLLMPVDGGFTLS